MTSREKDSFSDTPECFDLEDSLVLSELSAVRPTLTRRWSILGTICSWVVSTGVGNGVSIDSSSLAKYQSA